MVDPKLARAYGTLAGFGFIGVALLALPSTRLLDPTPAPEAYLLTLLGLVTGLACLAIPWDWLDPRWLHVAGAVATVETAATVAVFGTPYVALYFLIAVLVAYVAPDPRTVGLQVGLIALALLGPVFYGPEDARTSANVALVVAPPLLLTVALFSYLRMKMVHDRRAYHRFAEQTMVLSSRIAGRQIGPMGLVPQHAEPVSRFSGFQPPARWIAVAAALLGIPLFAGSLAVAGVRLPDVATDSFERVGIELPNQEPEASAPAAETPSPARAQARRRAAGSAGDGRSNEDQAAKAKAGGKPEDGSGAGSAPSPTGPVTAAGEGPAPAASESPADPTTPANPSPGEGGSAHSPTPLEDLLNDATHGLQGLLNGLKLSGK